VAAGLLRRHADAIAIAIAIAIGLSGGKNRFNLQFIQVAPSPRPGRPRRR
jgi:hypothetical protein